MMPSASGAGPSVVLLGATTLLGEEIRRQLAARRFPLRDLAMMGEGDEVGQIVEFDGEARLVTELDADRLERADLLFLGARGPAARRALEALRRGRGVAVDLVEAEAAGSDPVVNMEINPRELPTNRPARVRAPHSVSQTLSSTLAAVARGAQILDLNVVVLTPVSDRGEPGIDELYRQTAGVLNFGDKPLAVFERQVAFNAVPHALLHVQQGQPDLDARLQEEVVRLLGLAPERVRVRAVLIPVFHGTAMVVSARCEPRPPAAERRRLLDAEPFALGPMTPAELQESEATHVTDLGDEAGGRFGLWIVADNLRASGALNGVRIAEAVMNLEPR